MRKKEVLRIYIDMAFILLYKVPCYLMPKDKKDLLIHSIYTNINFIHTNEKKNHIYKYNFCDHSNCKSEACSYCKSKAILYLFCKLFLCEINLNQEQPWNKICGPKNTQNTALKNIERENRLISGTTTISSAIRTSGYSAFTKNFMNITRIFTFYLYM